MTDQPASATVLEAAIESELTASQDQIGALLDIGRKRSEAAEAEREAEDAEWEATGGAVLHEPLPKWILTDEESATLDRLQARMKRLRQVQKLFKDDPELIRIVDETIGNQVKAAEQRQRALARASQSRQAVLSVVFSVLSLIAGWLLSAVSPVSAVAHLAGR